jgi:hypothetical protein
MTRDATTSQNSNADHAGSGAPRDDGAPGSFDSILAALNTIAECFASDGGIILNAPPAGPDRDQAIADIRWLVAHLPSLIADSADLMAIREQCRVVYYPPMSDPRGTYPIEHTMAARKDSWT